MKLKYLYIILIGCFIIASKNVLAFTHSPETILIGAQYNGAKLHISGDVLKDKDIIVEIRGTEKDAHFKQKGKVWGIFWMTVAHLTFKHAPSVYMLYLPSNLSGVVSKLGLGYKNVLSKIEIEPTPDTKEQILADFLKLKEKEGLYHINKDGVRYIQKGDEKKFRCEISIPPKMPPGKYEIVVYNLNNKHQIENIEKDSFEVKLTGFPKFISDMAFNHSLIYGILAVIIAILAGFVMGFIFKDKGGSH